MSDLASLPALRATRSDQAAYAGHALAIAKWTAGRLRQAGLEDSTGGDADEADERLAFGMRMSFDDDGDTADGAAVVANAPRRGIDAPDAPYRVFTIAHDRELRAATLVRAEQLSELREQLDTKLATQSFDLARPARDLKALLALPARDDWIGAQEEGLVDGRRLAQLVAMLVDLFARALDMAGAASEILGFTTSAWNGGRALRDWSRAGGPPARGRLNEVLHLVFKDAGTPWQRARRDLAALLKPDLFREGIDGEAVAWAAQRLAARPEARKWLVVVSDGRDRRRGAAGRAGRGPGPQPVRQRQCRRRPDGWAEPAGRRRGAEPV